MELSLITLKSRGERNGSVQAETEGLRYEVVPNPIANVHIVDRLLLHRTGDPNSLGVDGTPYWGGYRPMQKTPVLSCLWNGQMG
jgi:hypothetical protein